MPRIEFVKTPTKADPLTRYFVYDDGGKELKQVSKDATEIMEEARRTHVSFKTLIARSEAATLTDEPTEQVMVPIREAAAVVNDHTHEELLTVMDHSHPHEHEDEGHEHPYVHVDHPPLKHAHPLEEHFHGTYSDIEHTHPAVAHDHPVPPVGMHGHAGTDQRIGELEDGMASFKTWSPENAPPHGHPHQHDLERHTHSDMADKEHVHSPTETVHDHTDLRNGLVAVQTSVSTLSARPIPQHDHPATTEVPTHVHPAHEHPHGHEAVEHSHDLAEHGHDTLDQRFENLEGMASAIQNHQHPPHEHPHRHEEEFALQLQPIADALQRAQETIVNLLTRVAHLEGQSYAPATHDHKQYDAVRKHEHEQYAGSIHEHPEILEQVGTVMAKEPDPRHKHSYNTVVGGVGTVCDTCGKVKPVGR